MQENNYLLFEYINASLPYDIVVEYEGTNYIVESVNRYDEVQLCGCNFTVPYYEVRPYLRSLSSMTEEESIELRKIINDWWDKELFTLTEEPMIEYALSVINYTINPTLFDWCNKNHFDYRGLIPKGLAIEVTDKNNPYL